MTFLKRWQNVLVFAAVIGAVIIAYRAQLPTSQPSNGVPMVEVKVPTLSALAQTGETLFNANCAACHGAKAAGQQGVAPPLVHIIYEPNHHGDGSFYRAAKLGVRAHHWTFGNMPAVEAVSRDDVTAIIAYVRELQRANGIN